MDSLEKRVENLEKVIRENFNNLGSKLTKVDAKPDENSYQGGYIYLYCGKCSKNLATCNNTAPVGINYCMQCGTKVELGEDFNKAVVLIQHAKEVYDKIHPLKEEIEGLLKKVGKK